MTTKLACVSIAVLQQNVFDYKFYSD